MGAHIYQTPECQQKGLNWSISFFLGPFIGYQRLGDLLIRVLSWSLFNERGTGELSAGNTRICSRANKNNSRKGGRIQGGVEAEANLDPERPCVSGFFLMTSSWVESPITSPSSPLFLYIFCVVDLFITESRVLKSPTVCLLTGEFNPFTFNYWKGGTSANLLIIFQMPYNFFSPHFLHYCLRNCCQTLKWTL